MIQIYMACTVWGEPLCQTAQSFMPELLYGVNKSQTKVSVPHSQCYKSQDLILIQKDLHSLMLCPVEFLFI